MTTPEARNHSSDARESGIADSIAQTRTLRSQIVEGAIEESQEVRL